METYVFVIRYPNGVSTEVQISARNSMQANYLVEAQYTGCTVLNYYRV